MSRELQLRRDLVIVEQVYRGETGYVVKNPLDNKYFRFRPLEVAVMQEFDGHQSAADIAGRLAESGITLTAKAVEAYGRKLQQMGLVERSLAEKSVLLLERLRADRRRRLKPAAEEGTVLRMRWSVGDPDRWLERTLPRVRFCFTPRFIAISILLFLIYGVIFIAGWPELHASLAALYTPSQYTVGLFLTFYLTGIVIIAIHELGHAYTCKYFGGRVHEMGAMLIYFEPAFYCNCNDAWTFPELRQRMWVTVAGSWIQMIIASLAAMVWWVTAPGTLVHDVAAAAVLVGGITTVIANANPLIPLDGYYALSDYLEIPNLRQRSFGYLLWVTKRKLLGLQVPEPPGTEREKRIFLWYALLAVLYITSIFLLIYGLILGWLSRLLGILGVVVALGGVVYMSRQSLAGAFHSVATSIREHRDRWRRPRFRAWVIGGVILLLGIGFLPWPITANGTFQVAPAMSADVVAPEAGIIERVLATEGERVESGQPLGITRSRALEQATADERRLTDSLDFLAARERGAGSAAAARGYEAERDESQARLDGLSQRLASMTLRSPIAGVVATARLEESIGRRLAPGERFAIVLADDSVDVRIAIPGAGAALVTPGQAARLISYANPGRPLATRISSTGSPGDTPGTRAVEARVRIPAFAAWWRPGIQGEARVTVRHSTLAGALWWSLRSRLRGDLLL
ncbi:MAG: HlyD family efflux transporter periplasmic adaptor subunit [Gemmatimonadota bacterium]